MEVGLAMDHILHLGTTSDSELHVRVRAVSAGEGGGRGRRGGTMVYAYSLSLNTLDMNAISPQSHDSEHTGPSSEVL